MRTRLYRAAAAAAVILLCLSFSANGQSDPLLDVDAADVLAPTPAQAPARAPAPRPQPTAPVTRPAVAARPVAPVPPRSIAQRTTQPPSATPRVEIIDVAPSEQDVPIAPLPGALLEVVRSEIGEWSLRRGETLRDALSRWSEAAGYTLVWQADVDFAIEADLGYPRGTKFRDAIRQTVQAFWRTPTPLVAHLYSNNVLVIAGRAP